MANPEASLVKDIFRSRNLPRKQAADIFTPKQPASPESASQNISLDGQKPHFYPAAIDIGSTSIKILQFAKTSRGVEVAKIAYAALPAGEGQTLHDSKKPLEHLIRENRLKGEVVSSLPLGKVQVLNFSFPSMPAKEIDQAVIWKLKQNPPGKIPFENLSYDYAASVQSSGEINVLVFAISRELVMERMKFFKELSLELVAIDPEPYAVFSALLWQEKVRKNETVLILHLGAREFSLAILHGGQLLHLRLLEGSGNTLTEAVMSSQNCEREKAESLKAQEGLKNWNDDQKKESSVVLAALSGKIESLVLDIEHAFQAFVQQQKKTQLNSFDRIILCGGVAGLLDLDKFLQDRLEVPVERYDPLAFFLKNARQQFDPVILANASRFAGAAGSASRFIEW